MSADGDDVHVGNMLKKITKSKEGNVGFWIHKASDLRGTTADILTPLLQREKSVPGIAAR